MRLLWNELSKQRWTIEKTHRFFLLLHTLLWTLPEFLLVFVICRMLAIPAAETVKYVGMATGYLGICVGFFGGVIWLLRNTGR